MRVNLSNLNATSNVMCDANCNYETTDNELEKSLETTQRMAITEGGCHKSIVNSMLY